VIIQTKIQYSDHELVQQIAENPYLQYFIGLPGYQKDAPFDAVGCRIVSIPQPWLRPIVRGKVKIPVE